MKTAKTILGDPGKKLHLTFKLIYIRQLSCQSLSWNLFWKWSWLGNFYKPLALKHYTVRLAVDPGGGCGFLFNLCAAFISICCWTIFMMFATIFL